jgi:hypothetical protein
VLRFPKCVIQQFHVWSVSCHYGLVRAWIADGGDSLKVWRVVANILSSCGQLMRDSPPSWELGVG